MRTARFGLGGPWVRLAVVGAVAFLMAGGTACSPSGGGGGDGGRAGDGATRSDGRWTRPEPPVRRGPDGGVIVADGAPVPDGAVTRRCGRAPDQPCCRNRFGGYSCDRGMRCDESSRVCRVVPGGACTRTEDCAGGLTCDPGSRTCIVEEGGTCVAAADCGEGTGRTCLDGVCKPPPAECGREGQPSCGGVCLPGFAPGSGGTCIACGGEGQPCCEGPRKCGRSGDLVCNAGTCKTPTTCGSPGQPCCPSTPGGTPDSCSRRGRCDMASGTCEERPAPGTDGSDCGADGQPCCPGKTCAFGAICEPRFLNRCIGIGTIGRLLGYECGKEGNICCLPGLTCEGDLQCDLLFCRSDCTAISDTCSTSDECCQGRATYCRPSPEVQRCCLEAGESCETDLDCCGWMVCSDGQCACREQGDVCAQDEDCCPGTDGMGGSVPSKCVDGRCQPGENACVPLNHACTEGGTGCCSGLACSTTVYESEEEPTHCCAPADTACTDDLDCCGLMYCTDGKCECGEAGDPCISDVECCEGSACIQGKCYSTVGCGRLGDTCATSSECCGQVVCQPESEGGDRICCVEKRRQCTSDADCCGYMRCVYDSGTGNKLCQCQPEGQACVYTSECCTGLACNSGTCERP